MTISLGDISVRYVRLLLQTAEDNGIKTDAIRRQFLLRESLLNTPFARISIPRFMRLGESLITLSGQPDLGLKTGLNARLHHLGQTGFAALTAPSIIEALNCICRFEPLNSQNIRGHSTVTTSEQETRFNFYSISPYNRFNRFVVDMALASSIQFVNELANKTLAPKRINIEFPAPRYVDRYQQHLPIAVAFSSQENSVTYDTQSLRQACAFSNPLSHLEQVQTLHQQLAAQLKHQTLTEQVMKEIGPLLTKQQPTMEQVAHNIGVPPWTLRRRLAEQQTTFKQLLDDTRKSLAQMYLTEPNYRFEHIAYLIGFKNSTAFYRAFKRWFNMTPTQYMNATRIPQNDES